MPSLIMSLERKQLLVGHGVVRSHKGEYNSNIMINSLESSVVVAWSSMVSLPIIDCALSGFTKIVDYFIKLYIQTHTD